MCSIGEKTPMASCSKEKTVINPIMLRAAKTGLTILEIFL